VTAVLVDTGAWIALGSPRDAHHGAATEHFEALAAGPTRFVTTNYIVAETATHLRYGAGLSNAIAFKSMLERTAARGLLRIIWIDPRLEAEGWAVLRHYADVELSLTDATSAAAARHRRIHEIFGFDRDFEALGFRVAPAPS
jgi:predicted nucleic acid-binding protein